VVLNNETLNTGELIFLGRNNDDIHVFTNNLWSEKLLAGV
jgi:hypothetical protein